MRLRRAPDLAHMKRLHRPFGDSTACSHTNHFSTRSHVRFAQRSGFEGRLRARKRPGRVQRANTSLHRGRQVVVIVAHAPLPCIRH